MSDDMDVEPIVLPESMMKLRYVGHGTYRNSVPEARYRHTCSLWTYDGKEWAARWQEEATFPGLGGRAIQAECIAWLDHRYLEARAPYLPPGAVVTVPDGPKP